MIGPIQAIDDSFSDPSVGLLASEAFVSLVSLQADIEERRIEALGSARDDPRHGVPTSYEAKVSREPKLCRSSPVTSEEVGPKIHVWIETARFVPPKPRVTFVQPRVCRTNSEEIYSPERADPPTTPNVKDLAADSDLWTYVTRDVKPLSKK